MTVKELIEVLEQIDDKDRIVKLSVNDVITANFHINIRFGVTSLYLSNANEEGYKPQNIDWSELGL